MEIRPEILIVILASGVVTLLPRVLPLMVLSRFQLPQAVADWLKHVPVAVMSALIAQSLFLADEKPVTGPTLEMAAALVSFWVAVKTRSLLGTVVAGVACTMALRWMF
jgi:branched-subunit amino acid transport protein